MRRLRIAFASLTLCACSTAEPAQLPTNLDAEQWREDLRTLARELPKKHANAFHSLPKTRFDSAVAALNARLAGASADAVVVGIAAIAASIGDGHTRVRLPASWVRMPLTLEWFGCIEGSLGGGLCELRVTSVARGNERALGASFTKLEGNLTAQIERSNADLIKWSFVFWVGAVTAVAALAGVLRS